MLTFHRTRLVAVKRMEAVVLDTIKIILELYCACFVIVIATGCYDRFSMRYTNVGLCIGLQSIVL